MERVSFRFNIGDEVKDKVTGMKGIVMVQAFYATGCSHFGIQQRSVSKEGKTPNYEYFDESRLELITEKVVDFNIKKPTSGPTRSSDLPPRG